MKRILLLCVLLVVVLIPTSNIRAGNLTWLDVDGMSIFGYNYNEYIYIGSIANKFSSESIANDFGWGSKFKLHSIMNEFGRFGSKFSSYSAFNSFATTPPIIINKNNEFVCYLTVNNFKTPSITTDSAIECAINSFKSPISAHKDIIFKDIPPESGGSSVEDKLIQEQFTLLGNYPNPFNPSTNIQFEIPEKSHVRLSVYSITGQSVISLIDWTVAEGRHIIKWEPVGLSAGLYLYSLEAGKKKLMGKMLYLK